MGELITCESSEELFCLKLRYKKVVSGDKFRNSHIFFNSFSSNLKPTNCPQTANEKNYISDTSHIVERVQCQERQL